jgi:hypothetical protein
MIKPKNSEIDRWKKNERSKSDLVQKPPSTSSWLNTEMTRPASEVVKIGPSCFSRSCQYFYGRKLVQPTIHDTTTAKFRRSVSLSTGVSSGALPPDRATNAQVVGASTDNVSALSTLDGVVRSVDSGTNVFSPRVARTAWRSRCR